MVTLQCKKCGKDFQVSPSRAGKRSCCSKECFDGLPKTWLVGHKHGFEKGFTPWNKGLPMSEEAKEKLKETLKIVRPKKPAKEKLPHPCRWKKGDNAGEKHWAWKGGNSYRYKKGYKTVEYREWRTAVFERDNYTCKCGFKGSKGYITAHHIKSFAHYPELRYEVSNGITLCEKCHSETDNYKGRNKIAKL
jgi:hypothetical protein